MSIPNPEEASSSRAEDTSQSEETRPTQIKAGEELPNSTEAPVEPPPTGEDTLPSTVEPQPRPRRWLWIVLGLLLMLVLGFVGGYLGYRTAVQARVAAESAQVAVYTTTQFQLGLVDEQAGRFDFARQRFEEVIRYDPQFPGAAEHLAKVELAASQIETSTPVPTPTTAVSPTPDLRGVADLFNQARQDLADKKWQDALDTLDATRKANIQYRPVDVDGMYYVALRYRGVQKILQEGDLEGGMYDMALAERFGPLDSEAEGYRTWARYYVIGASFWKIDWQEAVYYFGMIYTGFPTLRDSATNLTAQERFRIASIKYGDELYLAKKYCDAQKEYQAAMDIGPDPTAEPTATSAAQYCEHPPTKVGQKPPTATPTPTPTVLGTVPQTQGTTQPAPPTATLPSVPTETSSPLPPTNTLPPPTNTLPPPTETPSEAPSPTPT